jgi:hypothetical protein
MPPSLNIQTTTNQYLAPAWVDQVLRDNFFFGEILGNMEKWDGSQMLFPIKYQKGIASVAFNGFDQLPTSQQPVSVNMVFYPTWVATNVALAGSDLSTNKTPSQKLNLMKTMMKSRTQDAGDEALLKVRQLSNNITDGKVAPDFAVTDYTTWAYFEQLLQPFQRNTYSDFKNMDAGTGYKAKGLIWDGLVIYKDKKITTGNFYLLNLDFLKYYGLNWWEGEAVSLEDKQIKGNIYDYNPANATKGFTWTNWIRAYNQGAVNGFMIMGGQLVCTDPFRNGVLTGIQGV